jgi:hypothetical protein
MALADHLHFLLNVDLFGKTPKFYYKGKEKRNTFIGAFFTVAYIVIYACFFIFKINKMMKREDISYDENYIYTDDIPSIKLTNENFYPSFALANPSTLKSFIDETIYFPVVYFYSGKKINGELRVIPKVLEVERCKIEKFGSNYRDAFKNTQLNNLYCIKEINEALEGNMHSDIYSNFMIDFFPCVNSSENNNFCKPKEIIDMYINTTCIELNMQDIELTPQNYTTPIKYQKIYIPWFASKYYLHQNIFTKLRIVNIETDEDILGFKVFHKVKKEKYLKFDESIADVSPSNGYEISSFCTINIQLADKVLTQKRTYPKLIDVLGEVGGFMEVIYSVFQVILVFVTDNLYDLSLVNNLFSFDLGKETIIIKNNKNTKNENIMLEDKSADFKSKILLNDISSNRTVNIHNEQNLTNTNNIIKDDNLNKDSKNNHSNLLTRSIKIEKKKKN